MQDITMHGFNDHLIEATDGIRIFARDFASDVKSTPIICLPGLTRNHRDFTQLAQILAAGETPRRVICIDLRGRGNSDRDSDPNHYNLLTEMTDVVTVMDALNIVRADFIGTSRGGLLMHFMANMHPTRIRRVVLNDIGPVIEKQGLLLIRDYLTQEQGPQTWEACASYLQAIHGKAFSALQPADWEDMGKALYRDDNGVPVADYDPAIAAQISGYDFSQPIPDLWVQYEALCQFPLLIIRGENSQLLSPQSCDRMMARHPMAKCIIAPGQGHAPLLHIGPITQTIFDFLKDDEIDTLFGADR
ncbi:pimeloyl-ACP methyl ester carboxylesterase [Agrobacterium vitis]|nr:pimeloyl-ACP methyl ester carboxylesterase [Agrobacterium vitis]MBE1439135.1 pimeloyl-ACP methyl ester carboxylesterase [Agrobacterium vitis]